MTDRDTFAAAALTGLLGGPGDKDFSMDYWARHAYEAADAMLRERERTNHDAAPAATARTDADRDRTDKAATRPGEGTGDIPDSRTRDIVTRLRRWCHAVDAESAQDLMDEAASEIERLRIRDCEREAIAAAAASVMLDDDSNWTTLKELLERTK